MKNLFSIIQYILVLLVAIGFVSCSNEIDLQEEQTLETLSPDVQGDKLVAYPLRKHSTRSEPAGQSWDDWKKVKLASGDSVYVPWNNRFTSSTIPAEIRQDINSNKGWNLIAHTVNGYGEPGMNYLIFHNRYTGILKVFYYLEPTHSALQNTAIWKLHFEVPQSCLAFSETFASISTKKDVNDIYLGNITNDDSKGYTVGWNCFQTELAYDPDLTKGTLQIIPSSMTTSSIQLSGGIETKTEGLIISATTSNIMNGAVKSTANFVGKEAEKWAQKAVAEKLFKQIGSLVVKGAGSLVSSGISNLLGSFIGGFNKQQQTTQSVQLRTNGTVTLDGEIKTLQTGLVSPLSLSIAPEDVGTLGAWCMIETPMLLLFPYALHEQQDPNNSYIQHYNGATVSYRVPDNSKLIINPDLRPHLKSYEVNAALFENYDFRKNDALNQGFNAVYSPVNTRNTHLYDNIYTPTHSFIIPVVIKDKNGVDLENVGEQAPFEIYIPKTPKGELGACPHFSINSHFVMVVSVKMKVMQDGEETTIISSHTFVPDFRWEIEQNGDYYYSLYPFVPFGTEIE